MFEKTTKELLNSIFLNEKDMTPETLNNLENCLNNIQKIEHIVNRYLKEEWNFKRLNNVEKAILVNATFEILILKLAPAIAINEAIVIAKKYCDPKAYKLINATLDSIKNLPIAF